MSIKQTLIENEAKHSLFEESLRNLPITILPNFFRDNIIRPLVFDIHEQHLPIKDSIRPYFNALNKDDVLVGSSDVLTVENKNIAVLFSGGPAAGGHNVIAGLKHALGNKNTLYGVQKGPKGLIEGQLVELSDEDIKNVINLGGFDLLGSDRTKIKSKDQFNKVKKTVADFQLDGLIIIGGDDSNTNAAFLAEELYELGCTVVGVPKTIDGDLQVDSLLPISFGFDTATKIYAELVGNILQDTPSSQKYWHFVKLMGRSASHITLEVALQTQPHLTLISEEILENKWSLDRLIQYMASIIIDRSKKGHNYGVVLIPEGLIEFIEECRFLIDELNSINYQSAKELNTKLSTSAMATFKSLPTLIQDQLLLDRDSHGNLKLSQIDTQVLLIEMLHDYFKTPGKTMSCVRECIAFSVYFGVYDICKHTYELPIIVCGSLAGLANWTITYPIDVIKSRQMCQNIGINEALQQGQLWKGYSICALRSIIVNAAIFYTYETSKSYLDELEREF